MNDDLQRRAQAASAYGERWVNNGNGTVTVQMGPCMVFYNQTAVADDSDSGCYHLYLSDKNGKRKMDLPWPFPGREDVTMDELRALGFVSPEETPWARRLGP